MHLLRSLFLISAVLFLIFTAFSYTVAKEKWTKLDFDTTVKLQDRIPRKLDGVFSVFSFLGSAEVTFSISLILAIVYLFRKRFLGSFGWVLIVPATLVTVFGKLFIFHPSPPNFFLRTIDLNNDLPRFYVHSEYSYPSGHTTRTIFLATALSLVILSSKLAKPIKLIIIGGLIIYVLLMMLTRVYLGEHWLTDVIGGAILGISAGLFSGVFLLRKGSKLSIN